ncbi:MAG: AbrB/MazE/SpoVT family DNA-binding domain-containing protein [Firmicutes bacterium]|nr:AbrB/MazE/SpoVT family DNA-binding domain-containing protein [Bacillota bacterium]
MAIIIISRKGQIVIPGKIRQKYNLRQGDRLLVKDEDGKIIIEPLERYPLLRLRGAFKGGADLTRVLLRERQLERAREDNERA